MLPVTEIILCCSYAAIFPVVTRTIPERQKRLHLNNEQIERILNGCRLNERAPQKELYSNYYSYAMSIALRYSSSYDNAVEMTNDAFLKIYKDLKKFVPRYENTIASFTAWVKQIVIYACIDHIRKYKKSDMMAGVDIEQVTLADAHENGEQALQYKEIIKCIQQLSPAYKAVFNLYVIEGFSHAEIAERLNISEGTSKSNLHKAKQNLQELLKRSHITSYERSL
jgi:RNA polymerase sigma-70 factor, ECF subfamily